MTPRDRIVEYLRRHLAEHGYSPTVREIAEAVGLSSSAVFGHLKRLQRDKVLEVDPRKARTIRLL